MTDNDQALMDMTAQRDALKVAVQLLKTELTGTCKRLESSQADSRDYQQRNRALASKAIRLTKELETCRCARMLPPSDG